MKNLKITSLYGLWLPLSLVLILFCQACKQGNTQENSQQHLPDDFIEFYTQFHKDSVYQMNHIIFPLQGKPNNNRKDRDYTYFYWSDTDWVTHRDMGELLNSYNKRYSIDSTFITEEIFHNTETFKIERRFSKIGSQWYLVYYAGLTMEKSIFQD